jgi:hypothetical protein
MAKGRLMILRDDGRYETYRGQAVAVFKIVAESDLQCVYATFTTQAEAEKYFQVCKEHAERMGLHIYE